RVPAEMLARGCTRNELVAHHHATGLFPTDDRERHMEEIERESAGARSFTKLVETTDGRTIAIINRSIAGGFRVSTHENITESRQREASFRMLFESNPLPMFVYDVNSFEFVDVNDTAVAYFGYARGQFLAMKVLDIWPVAERDKYAKIVRTWS